VNPAVQRIYGYTPKELIGQPLTMLGWENQGQRDLDRLYRLLAGTPCAGYHTLHRTKDGRCLRIAVTAEARRDEQGRVNGALGFATPEDTESDNGSGDRIN
jgi:PAS domain S-box-containing protein